MKYENLTLDEERALYGLDGADIISCKFEGPADGESALKECKNLNVKGCDFLLRYPLWHAANVDMSGCKMTETCRAAMWYDKNMKITDCELGGIKALRECSDIEISKSSALSTEFGWMCRNIKLKDFELTSEYPFFHTDTMDVENLKMKAKYSFQYTKDVTIRNSFLDTKDAFWHSENVTVTDSIIEGEYLAWYSKNLHLIRCKIIGTQPLCYCENLIMEDCTMEETDLSFENSSVEATVKGNILSVKNPETGFIKADSISEIILDKHLRPGADCKIETAQ